MDELYRASVALTAEARRLRDSLDAEAAPASLVASQGLLRACLALGRTAARLLDEDQKLEGVRGGPE